MDSNNRPLTEFLIQTEDGRNLAWSGYDKEHAQRAAEYFGHKVVDINQLNQTQEA
ncbi:hypothetical protein D3C79_1095410 [compost metagenome]